MTDDSIDAAKTLDRASSFTKSTREIGQRIHKGYFSGKIGKEYRKISGIRPDYVDIGAKVIYELKPFNPRSVKAAIKQLQKYNKKLGGGFKMILEVY